jgi:hypothetical protein
LELCTSTSHTSYFCFIVGKAVMLKHTDRHSVSFRFATGYESALVKIDEEIRWRHVKAGLYAARGID